jgi:hypothetical protein
MKRVAICFLAVVGLSLGMVGCAEKTQVQETKKVETPEGSTTVETTKEVTKSGDNPPAAPNP